MFQCLFKYVLLIGVICQSIFRAHCCHVRLYESVFQRFNRKSRTSILALPCLGVPEIRDSPRYGTVLSEVNSTTYEIPSSPPCQ